MGSCSGIICLIKSGVLDHWFQSFPFQTTPQTDCLCRRPCLISSQTLGKNRCSTENIAVAFKSRRTSRCFYTTLCGAVKFSSHVASQNAKRFVTSILHPVRRLSSPSFISSLLSAFVLCHVDPWPGC